MERSGGSAGSLIVGTTAPDSGRGASLSIRLSAVIVTATVDEPRVLTVRIGREPIEALPSGPLEVEHRTLEVGLRAWVERQTGQRLGYVEQLYTFGDRDRVETGEARAGRALTVAYLALVREARPGGAADAVWQNWYRFFPWEDWRSGKPTALAPLRERLSLWAGQAATEAERRMREERVGLAFVTSWNEELVLERYELLYEAGLVLEARRDRGVPSDPAAPMLGEPMAMDHRRILATAMSRLRGKLKYRPVVFELMPPSFTLLQLQQSVEALAGMALHKQNFRRLVEQGGLVERTGEWERGTGGRPAERFRFRREVLVERPAPGVRLPIPRRIALTASD